MKSLRPINIWSGSKGLGGALTNPTVLSRRKGSIKKDYPVTDKNGKVWKDAETAYKAFKTGDIAADVGIMARIITAKLKQHPKLVEAITERGGEDWLATCSHKVNGNARWEGVGRDSNFIKALIIAYNSAK
jgi:hypothetical protein